MSICPLCKRRVWTLKKASNRPCHDCVQTTRKDVSHRLARVKEQWYLFGRSKDTVRAMFHLEAAIGHARVLDSYRQLGCGPIVPSPPQVLHLLESKMRRVRARFEAKWSPAAVPHSEATEALRQATSYAEARTVICAGPPEPLPDDDTSVVLDGCLSDEAADIIFDFHDRSGLLEDPATPVDLPPCRSEKREVAEEDLVELCRDAARGDRRERRRLEPLGLFARVAGWEEPAEVADVSLGGISLATRMRRKTGARLKLVIGSSERRIEAVGVVRWAKTKDPSEEDGLINMGLQFLRLSFAGPAPRAE